ncbi:MAG: TrbC/VirB2 family protein [Rickettsiales bacterium]|nr:TrbC/VirB2 family protein [Rickettsiales bacterium]
MHNLIKFTALVTFLMLPEFSFCNDAESVSSKLCELRQMLCGGGFGIALVTAVVLTIGVLALIGKINWPFIIIMVCCIIVYMSAHQITSMLINEDVNCECIN